MSEIEEPVPDAPKPPEHPEPPKPPEPTPPVHDDTRDIVNRLVSEVAELRESVAALAPQEQDSSPTKKPWTHRKVF
jgi:hypothetical protein